MSSTALVHEHDKVAIARHIHQRTPHSALGKAIAQVAHHKAKGIPKAARALGTSGNKPASKAPKKNKVPFNYGASRGGR
jgi:hypothetical protein